MDILDLLWPGERKHIFQLGSQPEPQQNCKGPSWKIWGQGQELDWTLFIFYGPGKGSTFCTQVPDLNPNRTAKDHFGKGWGQGQEPELILLIL